MGIFSQIKIFTIVTLLAVGFIDARPVLAKTWVLRSALSGVKFTLSAHTGRYQVAWHQTHWTYTGTLTKLPIDIQLSAVRTSLGQGTRLTWKEPGSATRYSASLYPRWHAVIFSAANQTAGAEFPKFHHMPRGLLHMSLDGRVFTPPQFQLADTATPWVFFNRQFKTCVFAPASEILVSRLYGNGQKLMADGFNKGVVGSALRQSHQTILLFGDGIRHTIAAWGKAFRAMHHRPTISQVSTPILRDFGYWTDNGAAYFYNYIPKFGYAGTLLKIASEFRTDHIHLGYMELDSWWYEKGNYNIYTSKMARAANPRLPTNDRWNRPGGIWLYHASHQLFPKGLAAFRRQVRLPLIVHARWIAYHSPYHKKYHMSGIAPSSRAYWRSRAGYLARSGVRAMQQDWLVYIYGESPQLHVHLSLARDFAHGMAEALSAHHIATIYCMETSRFLMEAGELPDVVAMRGANDVFMKARWRNFIYNSMFIHAVGVWPWSDVYMSWARGNLLLSLLSGGPVGVGDPLGHLNIKNIRMAIRADGRLVKPAEPLMPTDATIVNDALGRKVPLVALTHAGNHIKTPLVFVFRRKGDHSTVTLTPLTLGLNPHGAWIARNYFNGTTVTLSSSNPIHMKLAPGKWAYWVLSPILPSGIAIIGDLRQMVPTGTARIANLVPTKGHSGGVHMEVVFAKGERTVPLTFYSRRTPSVVSAGKDLTVRQSRRNPNLYRVIIPLKSATVHKLQFHHMVRIADVRIEPAAK